MWFSLCSGRGLLLWSFLSEVKTTNSFDLYAFPPLNRGFSCVCGSAQQLSVIQLPWGPPRPPTAAVVPSSIRMRRPRRTSAAFEVLFWRLCLGNSGNIPTLRRRFSTSWKVEARLGPTQFGSTLQNFGFTSCFLHYKRQTANMLPVLQQGIMGILLSLACLRIDILKRLALTLTSVYFLTALTANYAN